VPRFAPELAGGNPVDANYAYADLYAAERTHFWFNNRSRLIAWAIRTYFPRVDSVFDVGCGTGGVLAALQAALPRTRLAAGDALLAGLEFAHRQLADVSFVQLDINRLPYDQEFDVVCAFDVLEHLDDDEAALREMYRATVPGGGLVVTVPQHRWLWSALDEHSRHRRRYERRDLQAKVERAGYCTERLTSFMTLTLPAQYLSRKTSQRSRDLDPAAEMRLNPVLNAGFGALCAVERALIASGLSLPAGGSLLLVARRVAP
jgi:SAM-dependent methyltransferase